MPTNVAELREAIEDIMDHVASDGGDTTTVYVDVRDLTLVRDTLTDGSVVFNIVMRANR